MMEGFKKASQIMVLIPLALVLYDLVNFWFIEARIHIRPVEELWKDLSPETLLSAEQWFPLRVSADFWDLMMTTAAPIVLLFPPLVCYIIYRIMFAVNGGSGDGYRYKSRH